MTRKPTSNSGQLSAGSSDSSGQGRTPSATPGSTTPRAPTTGQPATREPLQQAVNQTQEKVGQVVDQAQETMGQAVDQAKQTATSRLTAQKDRATDSLVLVAQALRQTGQELRGQDQGMISEYIDTAAQQVERFYRFLHGRDVNDLVGEVERFARRQPSLFLGSTFALGLLGARFLKSSGQSASATTAHQTFQPRYAAPGYPSAGQTGTIPAPQRATPAAPLMDTPGIGRTTSPSSSNTVDQDRNPRGIGGQ
ncbi:MAG: hypothetical protein CYG59_18040 [Chloroflexi bacterium]|nr:MAG: hypothetical protein CYG59_18040 [Chloroflexota bacterium]